MEVFNLQWLIYANHRQRVGKVKFYIWTINLRGWCMCQQVVSMLIYVCQTSVFFIATQYTRIGLNWQVHCSGLGRADEGRR